jgi:hypothetical protein
LKRKCKKNVKRAPIVRTLRKSFSKIKRLKERIEEERPMSKHVVRPEKILKTLFQK